MNIINFENPVHLTGILRTAAILSPSRYKYSTFLTAYQIQKYAFVKKKGVIFLCCIPINGQLTRMLVKKSHIDINLI